MAKILIMSRIYFFAFLLFFMSCHCDGTSPDKQGHEYDPLRIDQADAAIAELKNRVGNLEQKSTEHEPNNLPNLDALKEKLDCLTALESTVQELTQNPVTQAMFQDLSKRVKDLEDALTTEANKIQSMATIQALQDEKNEREQALRAIVDQFSQALQACEQDLQSEVNTLQSQLTVAKRALQEAERKSTEALSEAWKLEARQSTAQRDLNQAQDALEKQIKNAQDLANDMQNQVIEAQSRMKSMQDELDNRLEKKVKQTLNKLTETANNISQGARGWVDSTGQSVKNLFSTIFSPDKANKEGEPKEGEGI